MIIKNENTNKGIGFVGLLTVAFIVLKLTNVISWSWIWVLSPLWISFCIWFLVVLCCFILYKKGL